MTTKTKKAPATKHDSPLPVALPKHRVFIAATAKKSSSRHEVTYAEIDNARAYDALTFVRKLAKGISSGKVKVPVSSKGVPAKITAKHLAFAYRTGVVDALEYIGQIAERDYWDGRIRVSELLMAYQRPKAKR